MKRTPLLKQPRKPKSTQKENDGGIEKGKVITHAGQKEKDTKPIVNLKEKNLGCVETCFNAERSLN